MAWSGSPKDVLGRRVTFRIYMHIVRAKSDDVGKEIALRSFFLAKKETLQDWSSIMNSLELIYDVENNWEATDTIEIAWAILYTYTNNYWLFPLHVFLHKYGHMTNDGFVLSESSVARFRELILATIKYFFLKGVVYNTCLLYTSPSPRD